MDMALEFAVSGRTFEEQEGWQDAYDTFVNPPGVPFGAATYGLFLNYPSAGIFGWHVNDAMSDGAILENVHIHDLARAGNEVIGLAQHGRVYCNAFNGPLPLRRLLGSEEAMKQFADAMLSEDDE